MLRRIGPEAVIVFGNPFDDMDVFLKHDNISGLREAVKSF